MIQDRRRMRRAAGTNMPTTRKFRSAREGFYSFSARGKRMLFSSWMCLCMSASSSPRA